MLPSRGAWALGVLLLLGVIRSDGQEAPRDVTGKVHRHLFRRDLGDSSAPDDSTGSHPTIAAAAAAAAPAADHELLGEEVQDTDAGLRRQKGAGKDDYREHDSGSGNTTGDDVRDGQLGGAAEEEEQERAEEEEEEERYKPVPACTATSDACEAVQLNGQYLIAAKGATSCPAGWEDITDTPTCFEARQLLLTYLGTGKKLDYKANKDKRCVYKLGTAEVNRMVALL
eukprot:TRINITY_DN6990_c1_g2_i2.p2 TRINITY_DN6990_c1_g2~~TRINITY_DN6990_c1_g2_i2.p2  ORF type:complete len:227 (+),score=49.84 TRINITY_DN6990_c1_g2_i2:102-782(+)